MKDMKEAKRSGEMTLGRKIRLLRLERKLTQEELVGDFITRNMLSQIENDIAMPSMKTLHYLSDVLEVPLSYLVDSDNEHDFDNFLEYRQGTREEILEDVERLHLSFLNNQIDDCMECCERLARTEVKGEFLSHYVKKQIELYRLRCLSIKELNMDADDYLKKIVDESDLCKYNMMLSEKFAQEKDMNNALECLKHAEEVIGEFPNHPFRAEVYKSLENCYVNLEDYKNAHLYSSKLLALFQK